GPVPGGRLGRLRGREECPAPTPERGSPEDLRRPPAADPERQSVLGGEPPLLREPTRGRRPARAADPGRGPAARRVVGTRSGAPVPASILRDRRGRERAVARATPRSPRRDPLRGAEARRATGRLRRCPRWRRAPRRGRWISLGRARPARG